MVLPQAKKLRKDELRRRFHDEKSKQKVPQMNSCIRISSNLVSVASKSTLFWPIIWYPWGGEKVPQARNSEGRGT
jgi:hypothetical protein